MAARAANYREYNPRHPKIHVAQTNCRNLSTVKMAERELTERAMALNSIRSWCITGRTTASKSKPGVLQIENRSGCNNYLNVANERIITHAIHELIIALARDA